MSEITANDKVAQSWSRPTFGKVEERFVRWLRVDEISGDIALQWMAGAILLGFLITYNVWWGPFAGFGRDSVANGSHVCWPFFVTCEKLIWLTATPHGYSQATLFMGLFGIMAGCAYLMYKRDWAGVHVCLLVLFLFKLYFTLISVRTRGNFDYYHTTFCFLYLFAQDKKFFLRLSVVFLYFLSTVSKIHPSWVLGGYFAPMKLGLPIFPRGTELIMQNLVVAMEMVGAWFLLSGNKLLQRAVFIFFVTFHIYSGILVGYRYPATVLPPLLILFGPWFAPIRKIPLSQGSLVGWSFLLLLFIFQMIPVAIEGDEKLTMEGNFYGLYMFEANHQCFGSFDRNGKVIKEFSSGNARIRCDIYDYWTRAKNVYCKNGEDKIGMVFNHSINGGPFREVVREQNICLLSYNAFSHNDWIKTEKTAPYVGRPLQNVMH
ncbi:hypothetical protein HFO10_35220 [Rhizobium laguerreae]|uniref:hypothetical protein n=1 Tax=Rhizobium laguerreae TaxID=1076926 RepID=UPI001C915B82|nr:hypothetical protein [Rhizobium laguerreae]MBY3301075.1 hypothetical protein [Rhizobium laguerreae]